MVKEKGLSSSTIWACISEFRVGVSLTSTTLIVISLEKSNPDSSDVVIVKEKLFLAS